MRGGLTPHEIVALLGAHPSRALGIDLEDDAQLGRWLVAVCLTGRNLDAARWRRGFERLERAGLDTPQRVAEASGASVEDALFDADFPDAERAARRLLRVCSGLAEHYGGSIERLASGADGLAELGGRLAALAPGFGAASVGRFLRPLRGRWSPLAELPPLPVCLAAADHLGLLDATDDPEFAGAALTAAVERADDGSRLQDFEAALEQLGRFCRANRTRTCPLAERCPVRGV